MKTNIITVFIALAIMLALTITPVSATSYDYTSKYVDTNPAPSVAPLDASGWVVFSILGGGAQDKTIWVVNKAVNATPFDCTFNPDKSEIGGQNPQYTKVKVPGSQNTGALQWANGEFDAYLQNGNGNQCEHISFKTNGGGVFEATQVVFQGAAVSQLGKVDSAPIVKDDKIFILLATYGMKTKVCTQPQEQSRSVRPHCEWIGGYDVVTSEVKSVVNMGYDSFVFSNGWSGDCSGGIYDNSASRILLKSINDPARDQVKEVYILYMKNGHLRFHTWAEYETITL